MKKLLYLIVPIILLAISCKKKEFPQNTSEDPAFYIKAKVDGNPITINAGMFGYYMFSDHKQDSNGIYSFIAELKPNGCSVPCNNSIKIEINDNRVSTFNGNSNINNSLRTGDYEFIQLSSLTPTLCGYAVKYYSNFNKTATAQSWQFGDGSVSSEANPTHTFATASDYNSCVTFHDGTEYSSNCNTVRVTNRANVCKTNITIGSINGNAIQFNQQTTGTAPFSYHWDFGDGGFSTQANPMYYYLSSGMYLVKLKVVDSANDSTSFNYFINTDQSTKSAPNFSVGNPVPVYSNILPALFSKVNISYTDDKGVTYISNSAQQPIGSNFTINSIEDFKANSKNQSTKKLKITFNCKLHNGNSFVNITDGEAVIAVSYK